MRYIILLLCLTSGVAIFTQDSGRIIADFHMRYGNTFYKGGEKINKDEFYGYMSSNSRTFSLAQKGFRLHTFSKVMAYTGVAIMAFPFGAAIAGSEKPGWALIPGGAVVMLAGIPVYNSGNKQIRKAIEIYHKEYGLTYKRSRPALQLSIATSANGLGLRLRF